MLDWWEVNEAKDGGAYLTLRPLSSHDFHGQTGRHENLLGAQLEFSTVHGELHTYISCSALIVQDFRYSGTSWTLSHEIPADPLSEFSVKITKGWIDECISNHALCDNSIFNVFPSRLIDCNPLGGDGEVRLVNASFIPTLDKYATLTHCWGKVERTTTTISAFEHTERGIAVASLSPVFRDAAAAVRSLSIRYL